MKLLHKIVFTVTHKQEYSKTRFLYLKTLWDAETIDYKDEMVTSKETHLRSIGKKNMNNNLAAKLMNQYLKSCRDYNSLAFY
jgi:hypothetical protein